jgi:hypothetical protein
VIDCAIATLSVSRVELKSAANTRGQPFIPTNIKNEAKNTDSTSRGVTLASPKPRKRNPDAKFNPRMNMSGEYRYLPSIIGSLRPLSLPKNLTTPVGTPRDSVERRRLSIARTVAAFPTTAGDTAGEMRSQ